MEDEESNAHLAQAQLRCPGYETITCGSVEDALEVLERNFVDVLMTEKCLLGLSCMQPVRGLVSAGDRPRSSRPRAPERFSSGAGRGHQRGCDGGPRHRDAHASPARGGVQRSSRQGEGKVGEAGLEPATRSSQSYASTN